MIDLYDSQRRDLVWHGWATGRRPEADPPKVAGIVQQAAREILERFPR